MNVALRSIKNNRAVLLLAPKRERLTEGATWPNNLPPPVVVADTEAKARAVSLLRCFVMRDHQPVHACDLTATQARDVVKHLSPSSPAGEPATIPVATAGGASSSLELEA